MTRRSLIVAALACASLGWSAEAPRPVVLVSIPPQVWLTRALVGSAAEVRCLLPAGANPHTFEPDARQTRVMAEAQLFLPIGMPFERAFTQRLQGLNPRLVLAPTDRGIAKFADGCGDPHEAGDPHIWLSPRRFARVAENTAAALEQALPACRGEIAVRLPAVLAQIRALDAELARRLAAAPCKTWIVCHPSWTYFAADYGFHLLTLEEEGKASNARHLVQIMQAAKAAKARAVFSEPRLNRRPAETLAAGFGGRVVELDPLQEAWPDLMRKVTDELLK